MKQLTRTRKPYFELRLDFDTEEERDRYKLKFETALKRNGYVTQREWLREQIRILEEKEPR